MRVGTFTHRIWTVENEFSWTEYLLEEEPFWQAATVVREGEALIRRVGSLNYFEILTAMMFVVFQQVAV